jgi:halocyanin-like protein
MDRRAFLGGATATAVALAGCLGSDPPPSDPEAGEWFNGVDNYDGFENHRRKDEVTVRVGAGENGFEFDPPAISIDPETTLRWEWTGDGGDHNVEHPDREWSSSYENTAGHTYDRTFSDPGTHRYQCNPHRGLGMKGAAFVDATD